jgi:hypothetical protein
MTTTSTSTTAQTTPEIIHKGLPQAIFRHWVHVREEDTQDIEVYKPAGSPLPPAFGRDGFEMRKDGRFIQYLIGPADEPIPAYGHWRQVGERKVVVELVNPTHQAFAFEIVDVDTRVLKIRRVGLVEEQADDPRQQDMGKLPPAQTHRRIDFERAEVRVLESFPPQYVLVVSGAMPYMNMVVELVPVVYIRQPEYWEIEVVGSLRGGIGLPAEKQYTVSLNLAASTGTKGIVVMGATRLQRFNVPPDGPMGEPEQM